MASVQTREAAPRGPGLLRLLLAVPEVGILIPLAVLVLVFWAVNPAFLSPDSVSALLRFLPFVGVIAIGQTFLMIAGEIDLSVGSVAGLCAIVASWLMRVQDWPVGAGLAVGLLAGAAAGLANGLVTVKLQVPAFITTLGMLYIARGFNYLICNGYPMYPLPEALTDFGNARPLDTSWAFLIFIGLLVVGDFCLRQTVFGRAVYATGGNREVARIAGINTDRVKIVCFVLTGALAALGGILLTAQINVGAPQTGTGWELDVIAGVVIGGVSLFGGIGTALGTFLGLLIMQVVRSGLVLVDLNTHWQTVAVGVIMIVAVFLDLLRRRAKIS